MLGYPNVIVFGAPCTGKSTLISHARKFGLKVADMDELMFDKYRKEFIETGYDIDKFVAQDHERYCEMRDEWYDLVRMADIAMVWPEWLKYFETRALTGLALAWRDDDKWIECLKKERKADLLDRMPETTSLSWVLNRLKVVSEHCGWVEIKPVDEAMPEIEAFARLVQERKTADIHQRWEDGY